VAFGDLLMEQRPTAAELTEVAPLLQGYDLVTGNIDTVVSLAGVKMPKYANLHAPRELAFDLRRLGVDVATLANNHTMDYGAEGLLDSLAAFEEAGVITVGAGANLATASAPVYCELHGRTVAIIACSSTLSELAAATNELPGVAPLKVSQSLLLDTHLILEQPGSVPYVKSWIEQAELDRISAVINEARSRADVVLIAYHGGVPAFWRSPSHPVVQEYETQACRAFIDAGADAVLGCHAHEVHGIEFHRNRPIFYCLANFWVGDFPRYPWMEVDSFIAELTFPAGSAEPAVSLVTIRLDEAGVPHFDPDGRAAALLAQRSDGIDIETIEPGRYRVTPTPPVA
jgi:poly-gamma-glutamate synthesis protein (capsule biosynthesis protein)